MGVFLWARYMCTPLTLGHYMAPAGKIESLRGSFIFTKMPLPRPNQFLTGLATTFLLNRGGDMLGHSVFQTAIQNNSRAIGGLTTVFATACPKLLKVGGRHWGPRSPLDASQSGFRIFRFRVQLDCPLHFPFRFVHQYHLPTVNAKGKNISRFERIGPVLTQGAARYPCS